MLINVLKNLYFTCGKMPSWTAMGIPLYLPYVEDIILGYIKYSYFTLSITIIL